MHQSLFLSILIFFSACSSVTPVAVDSDKYSHQVKFKGESLALIAGWYTGDTKNWEQLAKVNNLENPKKIEIGQVLLIPNAMLTRFEPLPESIIETKKPKAKSATLKTTSKTSRAKFNFEDKLKKLESEKSLGLAIPGRQKAGG